MSAPALPHHPVSELCPCLCRARVRFDPPGQQQEVAPGQIQRVPTLPCTPHRCIVFRNRSAYGRQARLRCARPSLALNRVICGPAGLPGGRALEEPQWMVIGRAMTPAPAAEALLLRRSRRERRTRPGCDRPLGGRPRPRRRGLRGLGPPTRGWRGRREIYRARGSSWVTDWVGRSNVPLRWVRRCRAPGGFDDLADLLGEGPGWARRSGRPPGLRRR